MLDPIPPPPPWLSAAVQPLADKLGLLALPDHIHELIGAFLVYQGMQSYISPAISTWLFPSIYPQLATKTRINWDIHVVSLFQSVLVCIVALWVILTDQERNEMNALERIYGNTGACGLVGALGAGYFIWDLIVSARYINLFGVGILAHAISALCVYAGGFRPYLHYYGSTFILYELSSPFLNIHWFLDKLKLTGSRLQWYNGILLLASFAGCRLCWGTWQSLRVYQDLWAAYKVPVDMPIADAIAALASAPRDILIPKNGSCVLGDQTCVAAQAEVLRYINQTTRVPTIMLLSTLISNLVLNSLNFYWYSKMINTVRSRFEGKPDPNLEKEEVIVEGVVLDGATSLEKESLDGGPENTAVTSAVESKPKSNRRKG